MNEINHALLILSELEDEWYHPPTTYIGVKKMQFELLSYQRWALAEIKKVIRVNWDTHPMDTLDWFIHSLDKKACETTSPQVNYVFSIAIDVAREVLDTLRAAL